MSEQEQTAGGRLSQDDWYDLSLKDPQAASQAFENGKVDLPDWLANEIRGSNDHLKRLEALDQLLQRAAETTDDQAPEARQPQQLGAQDKPDERPLPDEKIDMDHWHHLARDDRAYAQRIYDAGLVDMPYWIAEQIR